VDKFVRSLKEGRKYNQPLRNALFYGKPGTGKTLLAKKIAHEFGFDFAIIPAPNLHQFNDQEAIEQLNKLFDWAESSKNGTVLFFDEIDAITPNREKNMITEKTRKILNTLLDRTGTESHKVLLLGATNAPALLDPAFLSRMDEKIEFENPDIQARIKLLEQYFNLYIRNNPQFKIDSGIVFVLLLLKQKDFREEIFLNLYVLCQLNFTTIQIRFLLRK